MPPVSVLPALPLSGFGSHFLFDALLPDGFVVSGAGLSVGGINVTGCFDSSNSKQRLIIVFLRYMCAIQLEATVKRKAIFNLF